MEDGEVSNDDDDDDEDEGPGAADGVGPGGEVAAGGSDCDRPTPANDRAKKDPRLDVRPCRNGERSSLGLRVGEEEVDDSDDFDSSSSPSSCFCVSPLVCIVGECGGSLGEDEFALALSVVALNTDVGTVPRRAPTPTRVGLVPRLALEVAPLEGETTGGLVVVLDGTCVDKPKRIDAEAEGEVDA